MIGRPLLHWQFWLCATELLLTEVFVAPCLQCMRYQEVSPLHERDGYCFVIVFDFSKSKSIKIFFLSVFSLIITRAGQWSPATLVAKILYFCQQMSPIALLLNMVSKLREAKILSILVIDRSP